MKCYFTVNTTTLTAKMMMYIVGKNWHTVHPQWEVVGKVGRENSVHVVILNSGSCNWYCFETMLRYQQHLCYAETAKLYLKSTKWREMHGREVMSLQILLSRNPTTCLLKKNPLSPSIHMHILLTVLHIFLMLLHCSWENLIKHPHFSCLVIIYFILMARIFDQLVIL